jgi:hypothetical protein
MEGGLNFWRAFGRIGNTIRHYAFSDVRLEIRVIIAIRIDEEVVVDDGNLDAASGRL